MLTDSRPPRLALAPARRSLPGRRRCILDVQVIRRLLNGHDVARIRRVCAAEGARHLAETAKGGVAPLPLSSCIPTACHCSSKSCVSHGYTAASREYHSAVHGGFEIQARCRHRTRCSRLWDRSLAQGDLPLRRVGCAVSSAACTLRRSRPCKENVSRWRRGQPVGSGRRCNGSSCACCAARSPGRGTPKCGLRDVDAPLAGLNTCSNGRQAEETTAPCC